MKQRNKKTRNFLRNKRSFIFLTILSMGIGFAFLSSNLTITGNTSVSGNSWNVYFTNVQVTDSSVEASVVPTTTGTNTTSIDYTVTLDKPGDFYEFTVDAVNDGTIDAMIQNVNMTSLDSDVANYLSFTATYLDETPLANKDVLEANDSTTYKVRVEFKKNIEASDLSEENMNLTLTFGINYVQSTVKEKITPFTKLVKRSALSDTSINFGAISSASNGRGLYVMNSTIDDTYPIYYYRGNVSNNNAKFAGFCWKIVRTTETGGTKLIYNGTPDGSGQCVNTTGSATSITALQFNSFNNLLSDVGYMYGEVYQINSDTTNISDVYGSSFTYENGMYTLSETHVGVDSTHHYTCFSSETTCETIKFVFYKNGATAKYIDIEGGKGIDDAFREINTNSNSSSAKRSVDSWFENTFNTYFTTNGKDYNDYLEDTIWCNDRSIYNYAGWNPNGGSISSTSLYYNSYGRMQAGTPRVDCPNKNDSFTVTETSIGNGALTYPAGLLTADEINLAGGASGINSDYYLNTNDSVWSMTPQFSNYNFSGVFVISSNGYLSYNGPSASPLSIRPSISLKSSVEIASGDGSSTTPYEFIVE